ncbi:DUF5693 family protein [Halanaerobaculum tunisiense]
MRKLLVLLLISALVSAGVVVVNKYQVETANRSVELIMDYNSLAQVDQLSLLPQLQQTGLQTLAVRGQSLQELAARGKVAYYSGHELQVLTDQQFKSDYLYISAPDKLLRGLQQALELRLGPTQLELQEQLLVVKNQDLVKELVNQPLLVLSVLEQLKQDWDVIPRISSQTSPRELPKLIAQLPAVNQIIFSGQQVVGYPTRLEETAASLEEQGITLGLLEPFIAYQQGAHSLASLLDYQAVRVHSIDQQELESLAVEEVVNRYSKAVQERGVRSLYLKPYPTSKQTEKLVTKLSARLQQAGYQLERAQPYQHLQPQIYWQIMLWLGVSALLALVVELLGISNRLVLVGILISGLVLPFVVDQQLVQELFALGTALLIPCLVLVLINLQLKKQLSTSWLFCQVGLVTVAGGLLIHALLAETSYLLQIRRFRGVKLAFLLPLLAGGIYYFYLQYSSWHQLRKHLEKLLKQAVSRQEVLLAVVVVGAMVIYLGRTGNRSLIGVSSLEEWFRSLLERGLPVRPRFKSFLIGHPLLVAGIATSLHQKKLSWLVVPGLIGPINMLNTFAHLHTPVVVSLLRVGEGLLLGGVIGAGVVKIATVTSD